MNISEVKELLAAGFTHDEIMALENPQNPQNNPQEKPTPVSSEMQPDENKPESNPEESSQEENKPDANLEIFQQSIKDMIASNKELMKAIQASNLANDSHGNNPIDDINTQAEKALMSIIRQEKEE